MSTNINLLVRTDEESLKLKKRIKILNFAAITSLVCICLATLGIFILIQAANLPGIKKEQEDILRKTSQYKSRQAKLFVLNNRVENIDRILKIRKNLSTTTSSLLTKVPGNLLVEGFEVDDKSVMITGQSKSLFVIGEFISNLTDMVRKKEVIKSLTLNSLTLDEGQSIYQFSLKSEL